MSRTVHLLNYNVLTVHLNYKGKICQSILPSHVNHSLYNVNFVFKLFKEKTFANTDLLIVPFPQNTAIIAMKHSHGVSFYLMKISVFKKQSNVIIAMRMLLNLTFLLTSLNVLRSESNVLDLVSKRLNKNIGKIIIVWSI